MWVRAAIGPHLEELSLNICNRHGDEVVRLPPSLFNCTNLVSLSLAGSLYMNFEPFSIHFPSLKTLKLGEIGIVEHDIAVEDLGKYNVDSILVFLCGCPVLETLDSYIVSAFLTKVRVPPSSKKLKLTNLDFSWTCFEIDYDNDSFPKTTLGIIGNLRSVEEAYLDLFSLRESEFVDPLLTYLQDLDYDLHLLLRHSKFKVHAAIGPHLEELSLNISNCHGDEFVHLPPSLLNCTNLISLRPIEDFDKYIYDSILIFLCGCPVLETLDNYCVPSFMTKIPVPPSSKRVWRKHILISFPCVKVNLSTLGSTTSEI
ncbi:hypothetical protein TSUD_371870 [Trifolium subterraneum]|uniref:F-box/LRR-repeat protein 15/At3g58940/PEG3-like LRR domain-containing protein n=1 Tax=Trifolium subterraneum TaxID=3900 RepID=A0A2Z6PH48_TRISU|nr:hypothetical protein TSUD_371870 [Trifolium subterraneum]